VHLNRHPIGRRAAILAALAACLSLCAPRSVRAIQKDTYREIRDRYEGLALRLRIDLKTAVGATDPNLVSLDGVGYPSERSPVLFGSLETVFLQRITSEGGSRLGLTVYRSEEEASRLRASAIPGPSMANPAYGRMLATFARQGSTTVMLELKAGRKDPQGQMNEIEILLDRVFYLQSEPSREDLENFVRRHTGMPISRLHALTGLPEDVIRSLVKEAAATAGSPD
jgi:hypothetical protein